MIGSDIVFVTGGRHVSLGFLGQNATIMGPAFAQLPGHHASVRSARRRLRSRRAHLRRWRQLRKCQTLRLKIVRQGPLRHVQAESREGMRLDGPQIFARRQNHADKHQRIHHQAGGRVPWDAAANVHRTLEQ